MPMFNARSQFVNIQLKRAEPFKDRRNFLATSGHRARFLTTDENPGEVLAERTELRRYVDLRHSPVFSAHEHRLDIEWTAETVNWAKSGTQALTMPAIEIADPLNKPFPGFDSIIVSFDAERFLGRWSAYAKNGHGGNMALRELDSIDLVHRRYFQFSILQVFSPSAPASQVDAAEAHFKKALLTRQFGLNRN